MGKGHHVSKKRVLAYAESKAPALDPPLQQRRSFKEIKRSAILSGLRCMGAPAVISLLVNAIFAMPLQWGPTHELGHLELFAGDCSVTKGEFKEGRTNSIALDIRHNPETMDLATPVGFLTACYHATCLRVGGGLLAAPVCSSFVFMSSGTSRRSMAQPLGEVKYPSVALGNLLCARTLVVLLIAASLQCWWILEQPQGSWMEVHPLFQQVLRLMEVWRHRLSMGSYGAPSEKPTWLYSSNEAITHLEEFKPRGVKCEEKVSLVDHYLDGEGNKRIKGNSNLKLSQSYPVGFGVALARLRTAHQKTNRTKALKTIKENVKKSRTIPRKTQKDGQWIKHAELQSIFDFIS